MRIPSYPKIYNLGHKYLTDLFKDPVLIQEKYDGSQISFAWDDDGLHVRSKGKPQFGGGAETDKMFQKAVDYLGSLEVPRYDVIGKVFRAEYFNSKKHNTINYDRMPDGGLVLFDVEKGESDFANPVTVAAYADLLGIEHAATLIPDASIDNLDELKILLQEDSTLGGHRVEGIVIKNYRRFGIDGKVLMGKLVSEEFREKHSKSWKQRNPGRGDILADIIEALNTEQRFEKAVQHLRDDGKLSDTPADIGPLMKEVKQDTLAEETEWILDQLSKHFMPQIARAIGRGLPEWYKQRLAASQFDAQ